MSKQQSCKFCGTRANTYREENNTYNFVECPVCGRYKHQIYPDAFGRTFKDEVASFLYYSDYTGKETNGRNDYVFLGSKNTYENEKTENQWSHYASEDEIKAFYPKRFSERIDRILLDIANKSRFLGDTVEFSREEMISALFIKRYDECGNLNKGSMLNDQFKMVINYLKTNKFIGWYISEIGTYRMILEPEGWTRVDQIQRQREKDSRNVFVAMSFADDMKETRETIKKAITENGYIPRIMDEIEHNHQIVPEMLYEIRTAQFIIAELTGHNNGAYFEAGYALGYGKEVIQVCNKERFGKDGHFDVKQINTVMWENQEDLFTRLDARIKATIR